MFKCFLDYEKQCFSKCNLYYEKTPCIIIFYRCYYTWRPSKKINNASLSGMLNVTNQIKSVRLQACWWYSFSTLPYRFLFSTQHVDDNHINTGFFMHPIFSPTVSLPTIIETWLTDNPKNIYLHKHLIFYFLWK